MPLDFSDAVLLGRVVYIKGGPYTHTMETKQNKTDLRDLLSGDGRFIFPALSQSRE